MVELVKMNFNQLNEFDLLGLTPQNTNSRRKLETSTNCPLTSSLVSTHPHILAHTRTQTYKLKNVMKLVKNLILASFLVVETKYFDKGNLGEKEFIQVPQFQVIAGTQFRGGAVTVEESTTDDHICPQYKNKIKPGSSAHWHSLISLFHSVQIPVCDMVSHIEDRPSNLSYLNLKKNPLQAFPWDNLIWISPHEDSLSERFQLLPSLQLK